MIKSIIKRRFIRKVHNRLKGARIFRDEGRPFLVESVVSDLTGVHLDIDRHKISKVMAGKFSKHVEILIRQNLLKNHSNICSELLASVGSGKPASMPIPRSWVESLESKGLRINHWGCQYALYKYSIIRLIAGFAKIILLASRYQIRKAPQAPYVVFMNLTNNNLPASSNRTSYDVISWYKKSDLAIHKDAEIWAQVNGNIGNIASPNIVAIKNIFPRLNYLSGYLKFLMFSIGSSLIACFGLLCGRWWNGILFDESVRLHYLRSLRKADVAEEYYFPNSNWFHKPLWAYEAEQKGSKVRLYFYSTNIEPINFAGYVRKQTYGLETMQWRNIIVWDERQKDFLMQFCPEAEYFVVGPIDFSDCDIKITTPANKIKVAVFDVTPTRPSLYTKLGCAIPPYYSIDLYVKFIEDISKLQGIANIVIMLKNKRNVGRAFINMGFTKELTKLIKERQIISVDPGISARKLIEKCDIVISMPFTSTSLIGKELGKPSIYYDALGLIDKDESRDIPVVKTKDDLHKWLLNLKLRDDFTG